MLGSIELVAHLETAKHKYNTSPSRCVDNNGVLVKYSFSCSNASSHSPEHSIFFPFFMTWKKACHLSVVVDMNRFRAASFPVKLCASLIVQGDFISVIARIFSGLASIDHQDCFDDILQEQISFKAQFRHFPHLIPKPRPIVTNVLVQI